MAVLWQVGDRIQERWEVHHVKPGSLSQVYIVYDHDTRLPYAVKTLPEPLATADTALVERFIRAGEAWVQLGTHAAMVQAHHVTLVDGQPLLFLDYVNGGDLRDLLGIPRLMQDVPQIIRFALQCCEALAHALDHGVRLHRDLKPCNGLITPDGALQLTDIGLAPVFDGLEVSLDATQPSPVQRLHLGASRVGTVAGTPAYMAPELFDDPRQADVRADVYACGVLLWHMATGKLPFAGRTWAECAELHRTQELPALPAEASALSAVITTCLAKDPSQRFADMSVLREQLVALYSSVAQTLLPPPIVGPALEAMRWVNAGAGLDALGRHQEALLCYDRAMALEPDHELAWVHRGVALEALGRGDDALACCDHVIQRNARSEQALLTKAMMLGGMGQMEESRAYCDRALKVNPRNEQAWVNIGAALDALGKQREALGCYNNALTLNPRNVEAWFNAGVVLGDMGRHEEALGCCERALALNPSNEQAWVNRGLTLGELQRPEEALACFDRALELNPRLEHGWFNKGVALVQGLQRYAEALVCFQEAERLGYTPAAEGIALCRHELGRG
jgi:tetratricopeptide (TPR) repeat protein